MGWATRTSMEALPPGLRPIFLRLAAVTGLLAILMFLFVLFWTSPWPPLQDWMPRWMSLPLSLLLVVVIVGGVCGTALAAIALAWTFAGIAIKLGPLIGLTILTYVATGVALNAVKGSLGVGQVFLWPWLAWVEVFCGRAFLCGD